MAKAKVRMRMGRMETPDERREDRRELRRQEAWPIKFQTDMLNGNNVPQVSSKMLKRDGISKILLPNIGLSISLFRISTFAQRSMKRENKVGLLWIFERHLWYTL